MSQREEEAEPPLLALPAVLRQLDSELDSERLAGISSLAHLVDTSSGQQAALLGEYVREASGVEMLLDMLDEANPEVFDRVLMVIGNLCSDVFDPGAAETKALCSEHGVVEIIMPYLGHHDSPTTQLYAVATLQNLCHEPALASKALELGAQRSLEVLLRSPAELVRRFAAGALLGASCDTHIRLGARTSLPRQGKGRARHGRVCHARRASYSIR